MQRTLQPYSLLPSAVRNINHRMMDLSGVNTIDPNAQAPLPAVTAGEGVEFAQTDGAIESSEIDASTGKMISNTILNNTRQDQII